MNQEPKLLGLKHHSNFISEYLFDPNDLNLGHFIDYFEKIHSNGVHMPRNLRGVKDTQVFMSEILAGCFPGVDDITAERTGIIYGQFQELSKIAIVEYFNQYEILQTKKIEHKLLKLQRTKPCEGFHSWHADQGPSNPYRQLVTLLYLNDDFEGGETEFIHQNVRIKPQAGKYVIFPTSWTHTHRGNPPIGGNKYILTSWVEEFSDSASK